MFNVFKSDNIAVGFVIRNLAGKNKYLGLQSRISKHNIMYFSCRFVYGDILNSYLLSRSNIPE